MLTLASPVWQQAATFEPQACWIGTATVLNCQALHSPIMKGSNSRRTNWNAQAVQPNKVLVAVAASDLLAVAADGRARLRVDVDVGVLVGGTALWSGEGRDGHGGDEEGVDESHF
jgi:hypothetical protein